MSLYQRLANFDAVPGARPDTVPKQSRGPYGMCALCNRKFKIKQNRTLYKHRNTAGGMCTGSGKNPLWVFSFCPAGHNIAYDPRTRGIKEHGGCLFGGRRAILDHRGHVKAVT
jgi:hypothetical protein